MNAFDFLTTDRKRGPEEGITMMLDKGMGPNMVEDFLEISGPYVDFAKLGWGTSAIHERELIKYKVDTYLSNDIIPYPGGTLFELAYIKDKFNEFLNEADELGFKAIEISDGTVDITQGERERIIGEVREAGFMALTEVGKKDPKKDHHFTALDRVNLVRLDLDAGADKVIIEAREGGKGLGIYNDKGNVKEEDVQVLEDNLDVKKLIWEAPQKNQQAYLILKFGSNVNLGNISPDEITALETMRRGLRGDTLGRVNL
ncbi:MAG TPA: phosphosulfolactate synthase [Methanobacterium sp.]